MRRALPLIALSLAACGESVSPTSGAGNVADAATEALVVEAKPVRIGELGTSFDACTAAGTTRSLRPGETLPVRSAPFDNSAGSGTLVAGGRFFVCTRSLDQKWFGIVFDDSGTLAERCGVSEPVTRRQDYAGPCRSGWVESAFVKLVAGVDPPSLSNQPEANLAAPTGG